MVKPEKTIKSELVYDGSWIKIRKDTVITGTGMTATREIVVHRGVVVMIPLTDDGNIVLVRQYRKAIEEELLELPAGTMEPDEVPEHAAQRELREETGYAARVLAHLGDVYSSPGTSDEVIHIFEARDLHGDGVPTEPADEIAVEVVSRADAVRMVLDGRIRDGKSVAGILMLESASLHNKRSGASP
jgi:ADP-ribose pyrophosphatase